MEESDKKQRIITAAIDLFYKKDFEAASIQEITEAAGIAKGTLYLYFSSKDALIDEIFAYCNIRNVQACDEGLDDEPTAIAKLQRRMQNAIRWRVAHKKEAVIEQMYMSIPGRGEGSRYTQQHRHFAIVDKIIQAGIARGEIKNAQSSLLGEVFFGIGGAFYYYFRENPRQMEEEYPWRLCMQMVRDCLQADGLKPPPDK
ncbi:MAG: TetR/AcrR family transcriptional regulator [Clostridiales bacterium]|nr:TetR/AcrR family transcriptional regulator [Clostridiales bacterium]